MENSKICVGIDPGISGGISVIGPLGAEAFKMPETERDVFDLLNSFYFYEPVVFMEKVGPMPKQGVVSVWKFSANYNFLRGVVIALGYPLHDVRPQVWQKTLGCLTHGDKNISKAKAQQLFPQIKVTHATADSLLIAEYGRRTLV